MSKKDYKPKKGTIAVRGIKWLAQQLKEENNKSLKFYNNQMSGYKTKKSKLFGYTKQLLILKIKKVLHNKSFGLLYSNIYKKERRFKVGAQLHLQNKMIKPLISYTNSEIKKSNRDCITNKNRIVNKNINCSSRSL